MSIEARIAEVLGAHRYSILDDPVYRCVCGASVGRAADAINRHRAAVLVKELGLKQERMIRTVKGEASDRREDVSRYVTDWSSAALREHRDAVTNKRGEPL